jgi:site-specific DNA-methyltransferase (adenine-specific)
VGTEEIITHLVGGENLNKISRPNANDDDKAKSCGAYGIGAKQKATGETTTTIGRFPANLIHDNSEEVRECFPETKSTPRTATIGGTGGVGVSTNFQRGSETSNFNDSGNASRFFKSIIYQAKASKSERNKGCEGLELGDGVAQMTAKGGLKCSLCNHWKNSGNPCKCENPDFIQQQWNGTKMTNNHPTVKPVALMEYLIKMVTPTNGIVLDPFMGSGSTGVACVLNDFEFVGIDLDKDYCEIARARIEGVKETQTKMF